MYVDANLRGVKMEEALRTVDDVIGTSIDVVTWENAIDRIYRWAERRDSKVVCICNVHSVVTARSDLEFSAVLEAADMATPDGAPLAWMLRHLGHKNQERINGPDLMWRYCAEATETSPSIYLYGASESTLIQLESVLRRTFPRLRIAGSYSPPYRQLTIVEDAAIVQRINQSGAGIVWVSLGCPKQEKWMDDHRNRVQAVMVGVGAAFDYHAGTVRRAPKFMQKRGLEWLFRLMSEPTRLWKRYFFTNSLFIVHVVRQLVAGDSRAMKSRS